MLRELRIKNLAVIENAEVSVHAGLNILTGETGAGKSILIDAILLLCGARGHTDLIRADADTASVEAVFEVPPDGVATSILHEAGLGLEHGVVLVRRELARSGRHRAFVNDSPVTVGLLERLGECLVEIHGQHEHQRLLEPAHQLAVLDRFADADASRARVEAEFEAREAARRLIDATRAAERDRAQREDLLRFQLGEIDAARLRPGEEEEIRSERLRLQHAERFVAGLTEAAGLLYDDRDAAAARLARAGRVLRELGRLHPDFGAPADDVDTAATHVEEAVGAIRRLRATVAFEPGRLEEIDGRVDVITRLKRKYGDSVDAILAHRTGVAHELDRLERHGEILAVQAAELATREAALTHAAEELGDLRRRAAPRLARDAERTLRDLGLPHVTFEITIEPLEAIGAGGGERATFQLSTNPGEPPKPLARVASGGELARAMLAIKSVLAAADRMPTMIFDEVDAGIGGRVAEAVAQKLAATARGRQVLCVTHLAAIAARADSHLRIAKTVRAGRTRVTVALLTEGERIEEIGRMLGGDPPTDTVRRHARELLAGDRKRAARRV